MGQVLTSYQNRPCVYSIDDALYYTLYGDWPTPTAQRVIPILTYADPRLTSTIPMLSGNIMWYGFDNVAGNLFHSANGYKTGTITWAGTLYFIPSSIRFEPQSGWNNRLPRSIKLYGSNDSGGTWTEIYSNTTIAASTTHNITLGLSYTWFKIDILANAGDAGYTTFDECILMGYQ